MGPILSVCGESAIKKQDKKIEEYLTVSAQRNPVKMLLLGTGESGKSTVFKQLQLLHGKKYSEEEQMESISLVHKNIMEYFLVLLAQFDLEQGEKIELSAEDRAEIDAFVSEYTKDDVLSPAIAEKIKSIWDKPPVQQLWSLRANYQIMDALGYYLQEINRISDPEYVPSQLDVLSARVRSSGILDHKFLVNDQAFSVVDVGGQRSERKKWIQCFDGVTGIVFVVAISEYDQVLFEDKTCSRVAEAITVFNALLKNSLFLDTPIILLLNKNDVFEEKVVNKPFRSIDGVAQDFLGPYATDQGVSKQEAIDAAKEYMKNLFLQCNTNPSRKIYPYFVTALDQSSVSQFFEATKDILADAA